MRRSLLALLVFAATQPRAHAHFSMLFPQGGPAKKGEPITVIYQWGHPFEHQMFDAPVPDQVQALAPNGKTYALTKTLEKIRIPGADGKKVSACRFRFTPDQRGDYTFILNTPPMWMEEDKEFLQDTVKVVVHVQAQKGWDAGGGQAFRLIPLTRPYGLLPGMVFRARVRLPVSAAFGEGKGSVPGKGLPVFVERYNPEPPKKLPPDELITFVSKTDPNGVLTCTLPDPGWWSITAQRDAGSRKYEGQDYPVRERATLWVFVNEAAVSK